MHDDPSLSQRVLNLFFSISYNAMEIVKMHFGGSSVYYIAAETLDSPECSAHLTQIKEAVLEILEILEEHVLQIMDSAL